MIKINLSNSKKQIDLSNIGGFDFTKLNVKAVMLVIALTYVPDFVLVPMWEEETINAQQELSTKQSESSSLKRKVSQSKDFDKQIRELKAQEASLGQKLQAVKQAVSDKRNPASLLLYISKNVPNELWISELIIENNIMTIKGEALDYTSIGNFVTSLKSSVFIKDANIGSTKSTVRESDRRRIESFEVKFTIASFNQ